MKLKIDDKYTVIEDLNNGIFKATRYGEPWRNLIGDGLVLALVYKIEELQEDIRCLIELHLDVMRNGEYDGKEDKVFSISDKLNLKIDEDGFLEKEAK